MSEEKEHRIHIKIGGMSCVNCAKTIEKSLKKLNGVKNVNVNFANEYAEIVYQKDLLNYKTIKQTIKNTGYEPLDEKIIVKIGGMSCASCVKVIEKALSKKEGIVDVKVNLSTETAQITYISELLDIQDIKRTIENLGYQFLGIVGQKREIIEDDVRKELKKKLKRIIVGAIVGLLLLIISYISKIYNLSYNLPYLMFIISTPIFVYISSPIFKAGFISLRNKSLNMDVMYSMGIGIAFISSIMGTFNIILDRKFLFYDTAILLATFLTLGRYLETKAKRKTSKAIQKLIELQPPTAIKIENGEQKEIPIDLVNVGDLILIRPGDKVPVDGIVIEGESYVDESMVTGEPIPNFKTIGSKLIAGTINTKGVLKIRAEKVGKDTLLSQIIKLVQEAQSSQPKIQKLADRIVSYFIPVVLTIAITAFLIWYFILGAQLNFALTILISTLVVACPCALGLATPTAVTVGIGRGAELGILIKKSEVFELSNKLKTIILDKTGTITKGKPEIIDIISIGIKEDELLQICASLEHNSSHPIAETILKKAKEKNISLFPINKFQSIAGKGIIGYYNKNKYIVGNIELLKQFKVQINEDISKQIESFNTEGKTVILIAKNQNIIGIITVADSIKENSISSIKELKKLGLRVVMLTGDNEVTAKTIAKIVGIDDFKANVLPQEKSEIVKKFQEKGNIVAFVGDGINDAPALAQSDIGIAMGGGTDIAIESGDIVLMKNNLIDAVGAIYLSKKVMSKIKQNLFWAFAYNSILIPVAAGILYPFFKVGFKPELAGLAMALSSITVVSLSLLLKKYTPPVLKTINSTQKNN